MAEGTILKTHANDVLRLIKSYELDEKEFSWQRIVSYRTNNLWVSKLIHNPSGYYYIFDFSVDAHHCEYSPGETKLVDRYFPQTWSAQFEIFRQWVNYLKREIQAPDLWRMIQNEKAFINAAANTESNELFDQVERTKIEVNLHEIKEFILTVHGAQIKDTQYLDGRIQYLIDSSGRLGKKDWLGVLLGTLMNIIVFLALPSDSAGELLRLANTTLSWLIKSSIKMIP